MEGADAPPLKEKKGLKTVWNRIKDFFREQPTAAQPAVSATITPSVPAPPVAPQRQAAEETPKPSVRSDFPERSSLNLDRATPIEHSPEQETVKIDKERDQPIEPGSTSSQEPVDTKDATAESHMRFTKAQAIFARHNLELDETEWEPRYRGPPERVYKNIRMRVRYTCHNCSTTFGRDRVCVGCQHRRCSRCSRYPPRKDRTKPSQDPTTATDPSNFVTEAPRPGAEGGTCHECRTGFEADAEECPNCHHKICERCLHEATITVDPSHATGQEASQAEQVTEQRKPTLQDSPSGS
ncbi:hypothetical protein Z517_01444 [Fonsecaea pedrosoi CBS 271.37]|uniref:Uncharacterized protein n=1 Tax=Fonsecaea pedrosoi CBS 271.37 TaxID=1442368 RepID=A0A0D2H5C9_9EURO|nr:uncharacterized protein Z517_01444 [Fonsecaea pedrosoi CBS 271.37]KIW86050.1 hypothetical protein Z517_01444 [Fonsecaea pedrosoi CBS 271.37]